LYGCEIWSFTVREKHRLRVFENRMLTRIFMGEMRHPYSILIGKREGKRSLGRPKRRWEDNIVMDI